MPKKRKKFTTTVTLHPDIKRRGLKASEQSLGTENLSGYISVLIDNDCNKRNIK